MNHMRIITLLLLGAMALGFAPTNKFPQVQLTDLKGRTVSSADIINSDGPTIVSFWATWCKPCILELSNIQEVYPDWQDETGVKLVAISVDDARQAPKVPMVVNGRGWEYEVYIDANSDLRRALSVNNVPHTFLLDADGNVVWDHNAYNPGDEDRLYELVKKVVAGEEIPKH